MRVTYQEIALYGKKSVACAGGCGRRVRRSRKFYQTLNPFNKLPDGSLKEREDIYVELLEHIKKWKTLPEACKHCPAPARLCKITQADGSVNLIAVGGTEPEKQQLIDAEMARMDEKEGNP